ncbi:Serine/threonine-protein kinase Pkn1 [Planctomycetes bacterium Pla163]|uniref:Serine/threonine-protein kinase Pkn1 n=1 Tax=Rohdeia mirabilis TaxID=2528008 RepID=A0A518CV70_9BACT|nr:Serine/threonine-protein kinase Pkn1 [Planctomycetes bacterium Pla163]
MTHSDPPSPDPTGPNNPTAADPIAAARREVAAAERSSAMPAGERAGDVIDRYTLIEEVGEGGMGTVWMAEQSEPVVRRVALKIIKLGMDTREVVVRFEAERQALALMDHPHIAKVLDGGSTQNGRPYFVMELVHGTPISEYCDAAGLGVRARLELFTQVCDAVQHAHQKGIIHRDIKPSNVLVALQDGVAVPKVIDFGIAKATSAELTQKTMFTEVGQIVGTPEYMAPEQAGLGGLDIDTRADVYSLGVLLYELLTGTKPFDVRKALQVGYDELMRQIREVDPERPSTRVSTHGVSGARTASNAASATAPTRHVNVESLSKRLRGDLDWVVMRAIEKDRTRRYETASGLGADVHRYLGQEPVEAAPPSAIYRYKKFVRRRKKTVAAIAAIAFVLVAGIVGTSYGLVQSIASEKRATESEGVAQRELARANEVKQLVTDMLGGARPQVALGRDATILREIADDTAARLAAGEIEDPLVAAELHEVLGLTYVSLDLVEPAEFHYTRAVEVYSRAFGTEAPRTLNVRRPLVVILNQSERHAEAIVQGERLLDAVTRVLGPESMDAIMLRGLMGASHFELGDLERADEVLGAELETARRVLGDEDVQTLAVMRSLAALRTVQSRLPEALALIDGVIETNGRNAEPDAPSSIDARRTKSRLLMVMSRPVEAEPLARSIVESYTRVVGPDNESTLVARSDLANLLKRLGRAQEAEEIARDLVAIRTRTRGADDPSTLQSRFILATTVFELGDAEGAVEMMDAILPLARENEVGLGGAGTLKMINFTALLKRSIGDMDASEQLQVEAVERMIEMFGLEQRDTLGAITNLGWLYLQTGRPEQALAQFEQSLPIKRRVLGPTHQFTRVALQGLINARTALGDRDGALEAAREMRAVHLQLVEESPGDVQVLSELVESALMSPYTELHDSALAVRYGELGVELTERASSGLLGLLATAYFVEGRAQEAYDAATELLGLLEEGTPFYRQVEGARETYGRAAAEQVESDAGASGEDDGDDGGDDGGEDGEQDDL